MMNDNRSFVVAGCKPWTRKVFEEKINNFSGEWTYISDPAELTCEKMEKLTPDYIFFLHWSWLVPEKLLKNYDCVGFHMTDLPFGRGGSPLQNLLVRGREKTKLSAFKMTEQLDAGPIYMKRSLTLNGSAEDIYRRTSDLAAEMIQEIITEKPDPQPQQGEVVEFERRTPEQSEIADCSSLKEVYNYIRMLDAPGYPCAFFRHEGFKIEFTEANLAEDGLYCSAKITSVENNSDDS